MTGVLLVLPMPLMMDHASWKRLEEMWTFRTFHPPVKFRRRKARRKRFAQLALNASIGGDAILGKGQPAYYTPLPEDREQKGWVASGQVMLNLNFG
ncbi:hypothetical protein POX_b03201 [Penicillium oxalicum]|uniref:Uncharacterized protein n=1 Tax=Penicillium oxalicum (strain 114-2 / CGMCC 5302) TaxID=933388 RepID=S8B5D3_PENO1|nr:hypothetical protein POX_b03201 [Penicillium oxalicum]EPS29777.1 hypothetical protein PDE_04727 [Penicillium oxalicum 114-2]KAI2793151.1 hypothetical protein POX_b03201 [Penicillium oxalicum]